jgi:hypothetical protein
MTAIGSATAAVVSFGDRTTEDGGHAQQVEHPSADPQAVDDLGLSTASQIEARARPCERAVEEAPALANLFPHGIAPGRPAPRGIAEHDELVRVSDRQHAQEQLSRIEKMAVFAPIPSASDRIAMSDTTRVDLSERTASRRSCMQPPSRLRQPLDGGGARMVSRASIAGRSPSIPRRAFVGCELRCGSDRCARGIFAPRHTLWLVTSY